MTDAVNPAADAAGGADATANGGQQAATQTTQTQQPANDGGAQKQATTALDADVDTKEPAKPVEAKWRDDWRQAMAESVADEKERAKVLKQLDRFAAPDAILKSLLEAQKKISSGELKRSLPKDASPEDRAKWRAENGIPEKPEGYKFEFEGGFIPAEDDKPLLGEFAKVAHDADLPPQVANKLAGWYFQQQEAQKQEQYEADVRAKDESIRELSAEYGQEFKMNLTSVKNLLASTFGPELGEQIAFARMPDGRPFGSTPEVMRGMVSLARQINPGLGLMPAGTRDVGAGIDEELSAIRQVRINDPGKYYSDQKMLARERELIDAQQRMKAK